MTNPHRHRNRASPEHIESIRNINLKIKQNNRRKALQGRLQKLAYDGMGKFRKNQDYASSLKTHQSGNIGNYLQNDFMEKGTRDNILGRKHLDTSDPNNCQDEATCGPATNHIYDKYKDLRDNVGDIAAAKPVAGVYTGPGAKHSTAAFKADDGKDSVGHAWFELPDESIVDASAGQFINPKYKPLTQSKRFRVIPKESGLHKYYKKDKALSETIKKDMDSEMSEVARRLRGKGIDPFASRRKQLKGKLQKMADLNKFYNNIMKESARIRQDKYDPITQTYTEPAIPGTDERYSISDKHCGGTSCAINKMFPKSKLTKVRGVVKHKGVYEDHAWNTNEKGDIIDASRDQFGDSKDVHVIKPNDKRYHSYTESQPHLMKNKKLMKQHMKRQQRRSDSNISKYNEEKLGTEGHEIKISKLKQKIALIKSHVANQDMQADKIVDSYLSSGMGYKGMDGVYDHENSTVLNGFSNVDSQRMKDLFNGQGKFIGTNSVTDTRAGSNHDIERVRKELREVEEAGGIPALGFDGSEGGSLEALNISVVNSKEEVMNALQPNQWGTGILSPDGEFNIEESSTYKGRSNI